MYEASRMTSDEDGYYQFKLGEFIICLLSVITLLNKISLVSDLLNSSS